jgi:hypothetical protein
MLRYLGLQFLCSPSWPATQYEAKPGLELKILPQPYRAKIIGVNHHTWFPLTSGFLFFFFWCWNIKPRALCILGKHSTIELHPQPPWLFISGLSNYSSCTPTVMREQETEPHAYREERGMDLWLAVGFLGLDQPD